LIGRADEIAAAFRAACRDELEAPKPGNVHALADGHRMTAAQFIRSADAAAAPLCAPGVRVGGRILGAVEATFAAAGMNTNLGIILLCAPLAAAADREGSDLRGALSEVLSALDREDAEGAFAAIRRAAPGGLGRAERHDVFAPATATLRQAMAEAADRDRIAQQYVSDFTDVFALGEPVLRAALARGLARKWATLAVYLGFLASFPDTHVVRKHGAATAETVRVHAVQLRARLEEADQPDELLADLMRWDATLKEQAINPGTSADLTVATLFVHRLRTIPASSGHHA
jgi:triphosphoribosyl-dephospho-CoA synthase